MKQELGYYEADLCDLTEFKALAPQSVDLAGLPHASAAPKNVPIYDAARLASSFGSISSKRALMAEWAQILRSGAGVFVIKNACADHDAIESATRVYEQIIAAEKAGNGGGADHFAAAGSNDRIWNSLQKLCLNAPEIFLRYFASPFIDAACEAWLGPNYQMTAQVNLVHPGGQAQQAHRDYHLGFQSAEVSAEYPAHVHDLSPLMTLQGGVAHCDISIESGPTKFLPFSQLYRAGYAAWRRPDFRAYFEANYVQLPLEKGDAVFFSPALFHAAGENSTKDVHRMVNLLQVSSPFGRAMETLDRTAMCTALYPALKRAYSAGKLDHSAFEAVLGAVAEGYSFPTNLDRDPPKNGLAPTTQKDILRAALLENSNEKLLHEELMTLEGRRSARHQ